MVNQKDMFDEVSRLKDAFEIVKPHLTDEEYSEHIQRVLTNYKIYMSGTFNTTINRVVKEAMDMPEGSNE